VVHAADQARGGQNNISKKQRSIIDTGIITHAQNPLFRVYFVTGNEWTSDIRDLLACGN